MILAQSCSFLVFDQSGSNRNKKGSQSIICRTRRKTYLVQFWNDIKTCSLYRSVHDKKFCEMRGLFRIRFSTVTSLCDDCFGSRGLCPYMELSSIGGTTAVRMQWLITKWIVFTRKCRYIKCPYKEKIL